ncbi:MAG: ribosome hibernation-promoting factor, HPF/YfiA family [Bacteriovoracaceae bacterium]
MKITIAFKHLNHTEALDNRIKEKTQKLQKFFNGSFEVQWTCFVKDGEHIADVKLIGSNFEYFACAKSNSLYKTIDMAVNKLEAQVSKKKSKWRDHIHHEAGLKEIIRKSAA